MVTGSLLFPGKSGVDVLQKIESDPTPNAGIINPRLPKEINDVIYMMMQRDPAHRYQDASDLLAVLKKLKKKSIFNLQQSR